MTIYHEEKEFIRDFRKRLLAGEGVHKTEILELLDKFEEMTEMTSVTVKIIDRLMTNYDKIRLQLSNNSAAVRKENIF